MNPKTACLKKREDEKSEESNSTAKFAPSGLQGHHLNSPPAGVTANLPGVGTISVPSNHAMGLEPFKSDLT